MIHIARVDTHDVFVFTRRLECDPHCVVALRAHCGDEGNGIGVAISWCVTRIRSSARHIGSIDRGSLVLIPRVPFADARPRLSRVSRRTLPTCTRRRHADAPACQPHLVQDDGRFAFRNCSSSSAPRLPRMIIRKAANSSLEKRESARDVVASGSHLLTTADLLYLFCTCTRAF
jgi:hypothetical protein